MNRQATEFRLFVYLIIFVAALMACGACQRVITKAPYDAAATTLDGKPWRFADYRGKVVLLVFWSPLNNAMRLFSKQIAYLQQNFGARADFVIIGVPVESTPERVREYCGDCGMTWLQLAPVAHLQKSPLRAFPMNMDAEMYLINRDGTVDRLSENRFREQVEGALFGLTYESERDVRERLKPGMAKSQVLAIVGRAADEITSDSATETLRYRVQNTEKNRQLRVSYHFNRRGRYLGESRSYDYVNPARVHFVISKRAWEEKVGPALSDLPHTPTGWVRRVELHVETYPKKDWGEWTRRGRMMIAAGEQIGPGRTVQATLAPDLYDFKLLIFEAPASTIGKNPAESFFANIDARQIFAMTLVPAVELKPNEERTVDFN